MRIAIAALGLSLLLTVMAHAAFTDFNDYTQPEEFFAGETFTSKGLSFKAVQLLAVSSPVKVLASPTYANLRPGSGVEFLLPNNINEISLTYGGYIAYFAINGVQPASYPGDPGHPHQPGQAGFDFLNGTTLGGVSITATRLIPPPLGPGFLTLRGPITSLFIASVELAIDDITVRVPEPCSSALFLAGALMVMAGRLRLRDVKW